MIITTRHSHIVRADRCPCGDELGIIVTNCDPGRQLSVDCGAILKLCSST